VRYVILLRNEAMGADRMLRGLVSGRQEFPRALERFGGRLEDLHAVCGRYDAVAVVDFDDHAGALAFTLAATAQGQYAEALPVFSFEDLARASEVAQAATEDFAREVAERIETLRVDSERKEPE
jgi:uncharacterized protein with GYD domain